MSNYYNLDGIHQHLLAEVARDKALVEAWRNVKIVTKKDGKPFANMKRNFDGATYSAEHFASYSWETELTVYTSSSVGYINDSIICYASMAYANDSMQILANMKPQNVHDMPTSYGSFVKVYVMDVDDIRDLIAKRIDALEKRIRSMDEELRNLDATYQQFKDAILEAMQRLSDDCVIDNDRTAYYAIRDTVLENHRYV